MKDNFKRLQIKNDKDCLVSACDFDNLSKHIWHSNDNGKGKKYIRRYLRSVHGNRDIYIHRQITGASENQIVDHINGDTFDNRRENLRFVTPRENSSNRKKDNSDTFSKYKGVAKCEYSGNYRTCITYNNQTQTINNINSEIIASLIYDLLALDRFKEFSQLNHPEIEWLVKSKYIPTCESCLNDTMDYCDNFAETDYCSNHSELRR